MRILILDDKESELINAHAAVRRSGHQLELCQVGDGCGSKFWPKAIEQADAVITDLCWNPLPNGGVTSKTYDQEPPPAGLLAVIHALSLGKPVVICTNQMEHDHGHHSKAIGWIFDGYFGAGIETKVGWVEDKNWDTAVAKVIRLAQSSSEQSDPKD